jgi:ABC-2 type transport system permease protein
MGIVQLAFFSSSEIHAHERRSQILECTSTTPAGYFLPLLVRITALTGIGGLGFVGAYAIALFVFRIAVDIHHPLIFLATAAATVFAAAGTALVTTTLYSFGKTPRTYQNALPGPLYLLSGVLVPVEYLPPALQPVSRGIFFSWAADLLRDCLTPAPVANAGGRIIVVVLLGGAGGALGAILLTRLLSHLRREGTLGL